MKRISAFLFCLLALSACGHGPAEKQKPANSVISSCVINGKGVSDGHSIGDVDGSSVTVLLEFSSPIDIEDFDRNKIFFSGEILDNYSAVREDEFTLRISVGIELAALRTYTLFVVKGDNLGLHLPFDYTYKFVTAYDDTPKFPLISDEELLDLVQKRTFEYFRDYAHPVCGLARERLGSDETVTTGGSGFGLMALVVGASRGFISRTEAYGQVMNAVNFLGGKAVRYHGAFPHWMNGSTGATLPFSSKDNGADLVETAFLMEGLLCCRQYFDKAEEAELRAKISALWEAVEWDWFLNGTDTLFWHWSPDFGWEMNMAVKGWNEGLIVYVLAAASPTHPVGKAVYDSGWASYGGMRNGRQFYGISLPLGPDYGGPLFFAHYSFLGLDPRNLSDAYASYWEQNVAHARINHAYCAANPKGMAGYSEECWGLSASDYPGGYTASSPTNDHGTIAPTAALASMPYTPEESLAALRHFYYVLGDRLWGDYGFYDSFSLQERWFADSYIAIDQGPIIVMMENYRTGLVWDTFMKDPDIRTGLDRLDFNY